MVGTAAFHSYRRLFEVIIQEDREGVEDRDTAGWAVNKFLTLLLKNVCLFKQGLLPRESILPITQKMSFRHVLSFQKLPILSHLLSFCWCLIVIDLDEIKAQVC